MTTTGAEQSAIATRDRIASEGDTLARLRSEYEYLTSLEDTGPLVDQLVRLHGLDRTVVEDSPVLASCAAAHRAAHSIDPQAAYAALSRSLTGLDDADDEKRLRVLTSRLRAAAPVLPTRGAGMAEGLTARYDGGEGAVADLAGQVEDRMRQRIHDIVSAAPRETWAGGIAPDAVVQVALYRDLYDVRADTPLGHRPDERDTRQLAHFDALLRLLNSPVPGDPPKPSAGGPRPDSAPDARSDPRHRRPHQPLP